MIQWRASTVVCAEVTITRAKLCRLNLAELRFYFEPARYLCLAATISGLNWGWAEDITLNGLPGFGAWCAHHFQGHDCEAGVKEVRFRANIFVGLRSGKATVRVWDAIAAELSPE